MLGLLRPRSGHLDAAAHARYRRLYCGLCASLGREHGALYRMIHTYDGVFVALIADGLSAQVSPSESVRCPLAPHRFRDATDPAGPALRYASSVQLLALEQRFADDAAEGSTVAAGLQRMVGPTVDRLVQNAGEQTISGGPGVPTVIRNLGRTQSALEACWPSPRDAAAPTKRATADIFAQLAPMSDDGDAVRALAAFGAALGEVIYLVDALEDLRRDHSKKKFNPCMSSEGRLNVGRTDAACDALQAATDELSVRLANVPLVRNRDLAEAVVHAELGHRVATCIHKAQQWVGGQRLALERRAGLGALGLVADRMLVACVALWVLASSATSAHGAGLAPLRRANHFCHPDCVKPSTYCALGYPHDGRFAADDCAGRWSGGMGDRTSAVDSPGTAWDVVCPSDTSRYCFGECVCCNDRQAGETMSGCCVQLPGWCSDIAGMVTWVTGMLTVAWITAEGRVDRAFLE